MDIDVDQLGIDFDKQRYQWMAVAGEEILIGAAHRAVQQLVAHRPAVDEEILVTRCVAIERWQTSKSEQAYAIAFGIDRQRIF